MFPGTIPNTIPDMFVYLCHEITKLQEILGASQPVTDRAAKIVKVLDLVRTFDLDYEGLANFTGEVLREQIFAEPYGAVSCFDFAKGFNFRKKKPTKKILDILFGESRDGDDVKSLNCYSTRITQKHSILVAWHWDGGGTLLFGIPYRQEKEIFLYNTDCKKSYKWQWCWAS